MQTPPLRLLYFAWVAERIGVAEEVIALSAHDRAGTIADLIGRLAGTGPGHRAALSDPARLRAARDATFVPLDTMIGDAREIALFPPVTGG